MLSFVFAKQGTSCLGSSATWEHPQWVVTMFVISKKKEGEWNWERETCKPEQMFSLKYVSVQSRLCIHDLYHFYYVGISHQRLFLILLQTVDVMSQLLLQLRSMLKCTIGCPVLIFEVSVRLGASVLYLTSFIWTSLNFLFLLIDWSPSDCGLILV